MEASSFGFHVMLARAHFFKGNSHLNIILFIFVCCCYCCCCCLSRPILKRIEGRKLKTEETKQKLSALFCHFIFPMPQTIRPHLFISGIFNFNCQFLFWSFFLSSVLLFLFVLKTYYSLFE